MMKTLTKAVLLTAVSMIAVTSASAENANVATKFEYSEIEMDNGNTVETNLLTFNMSGKYASGFQYDFKVGQGEVEDVSVKLGDMEAAYHIFNLVGPMAKYTYADVAGVTTDNRLLGLSGGTMLGDAYVYGNALADIDEDDTYEFTVGGTYMMSEKLSFEGEFTHFEYDTQDDVQTIELDAKYNIVGNMYGDVGVSYITSDDYDGVGVKAGVSFGF